MSKSVQVINLKWRTYAHSTDSFTDREANCLVHARTIILTEFNVMSSKLNNTKLYVQWSDKTHDFLVGIDAV